MIGLLTDSADISNAPISSLRLSVFSVGRQFDQFKPVFAEKFHCFYERRKLYGFGDKRVYSEIVRPDNILLGFGSGEHYHGDASEGGV